MIYRVPKFWQLTTTVMIVMISQVCLFAQTFPDPGFTLPPGKTICITYEVTVNEDVCPEGTFLANPNISNQSNVSGDNFSMVQTDDPDNPAADPAPTITPIASLTLGDLVFEDVNRSGKYEDGTDVGIAGVVLNLYLDDGDGVLDAGDGAPIATTTTDDGIDGSVLGEYIFDGICPGDYIVEVAPSNFSSGNALFDTGLSAQFVSSPSGPAPDPDNDQNNDDNGAPVAGFGVASQAITLDFGTEPTNDGDDDNNTNLSLDFGFKRPTEVTISDPMVMEGDTPGDLRFLAYTITRSDNKSAFMLDIAVSGGTATGGGVDFEDPETVPLSFIEMGPTEVIFEVEITEETMVEADETVELMLSNAPIGVVITKAVGVGTIQNDDLATVTLSGGTSQDEGDSGNTSFTFTATLDKAVAGGFDVAFSVNDDSATDADDFDVATSSPLSFAGTAGEMQPITVNVIGDEKVEQDEDFTVSLGAVTNSSLSSSISTAGSPQTGTILNDDQATITISDVSMMEGTGSNPTFTFDVTLDKEVDGAVSVDYETMDGSAMDENTPPNDYNSTNGMLTFYANAMAPQVMTIDVTVIGDMASEPNEEFFVNLSNIQAGGYDVVFADSEGEGTIIDDDCNLPDVPTLTDDVSICPGGSTTIMVTAGNLDDATEWVLYSGSCGGTFEQSNATGEFVVTPAETTTYFVRGEGDCVDQVLGDCAMVTVTVEDNEDPIAVCFNPTVTFNGEEEIMLEPEQVWDEESSSDNCGPLSFVSMTPEVVTCDQLGSVIPVTVVIQDGAGNLDECTANVTVAGLPCGFTAPPDGINCADGNEAAYDPNTGTYTITSEGCYDPNYYSNSDSHGYVGTELCGDGEIIAQVTQVNGNGFAGISMREDLTAGSKMLQLSIDGVMLTKRELRQSTGGFAFNHQFQTQGRNWLRLTRTGSQFAAYHSLNGVNWMPVIIVNISMTNCIEIGLFTENNMPTGSVTGTFENVSITGGMATLSNPGKQPGSEHAVNLAREVTIYPNPAESIIDIQLAPFVDQEVQITVYNILGQPVKQKQVQRVENQTERMNVHDLRPGTYLVEVGNADDKVVKKLVISRK